MFAIAPTDLAWFECIRSGQIGQIVNFWTPTPWGVKGLHIGDRLYFMLKAPIRKIGGYGSFVRYVDMTAAEAWQLYGLNNGVESETELVNKVSHFAEKRSKDFSASANPMIGCIELTDVITLDDEHMIIPEQRGHSFPNQVVKLKYFQDADGIAAHLDLDKPTPPSFSLITGDVPRTLAMRKDRKRQPMFRQQILRNYAYRCCISGETIVELLEAAHIQPYIDERSDHPQNGLCLRVDLHRLFDAGLITVTDDLTVRVSDRLSKTSYYRFSGNQIRTPLEKHLYPSATAINYRALQEFRP